MHCVLAVETEVAVLIKKELQRLNPDWEFEICDHSSQLDVFSRKNPDVLVLSRFLPGEKPAELLKHIQALFPGSHIVLLVDELDEQSKGYIRVSKRYGLNNYVTGELPGDMPYTLPVSLTQTRENDEEILVEQDSQQDEEEDILVGQNLQQDAERKTMESDILEWEHGDINDSNQTTTQEVKNYPAESETVSDYQWKGDQPPAIRDTANNRRGARRFESMPVKKRRRNGVLALTTSNKGGAGKTTSAITLAVALSRSGIPVVLVDFDFEAPDVATFFDIEDVPGIESLAGRSKNTYYLDELLIKAKKEENLYILPGVMDKSLPYFHPDEVAEIVELLLNDFPVVVGDTPPAFWSKDWMPELLERADIVFSIVDQSKFSFKDTKQYAPKLIECNVELQNIKIVLNKFSPKLHNARTVENHFCAGFKGRVSPKDMPRVVATIPEDWDMYNKYVYKGQVAGLDDEYSQWHRLAEEVAARTGANMLKPGNEKKKSNNKSGNQGIFKKFQKWFKK